MMSEIEAVIVTHNSERFIGPCLDSCGNLPVLVVDNASSDATLQVVQQYPAVRVIANPQNRGFAGAVNQGIARVQAPFVLLLNPDVRLRTSVEPLARALGDPLVAIAAGRLESENGRVQAGWAVRRFPTPLALSFEALGWNRIFPWNPVNRRYRCSGLDLNQPAEVEQPAGAFMLFRRETWKKVGGFDEKFYPLWFEDVDFCKRVSELGYKIRYVPEAAGIHKGGHSIERLDWESRTVYWYASLLRYASKHYGPWNCRQVAGAVLFGCALRMVTGAFTRRRRSVMRGCGRVIVWSARHLIQRSVPDFFSDVPFEKPSGTLPAGAAPTNRP